MAWDLDGVEIRTYRNHESAGTEHLLAFGRQTNLVLADVLGVGNRFVMLRGMSARKCSRRRENERRDPRPSPRISDHPSLVFLAPFFAGLSECLPDADVEPSVSGLAPRIVDTKVYAVFAREKKANADAARGKQLVGVEIRKAVSDFAHAAKGDETKATEESQPLGQHEPVFSLRREHRPIQISPYLVAAQIVVRSEETQSVDGSISSDVAPGRPDGENLAFPDREVLVVVGLISLKRAVARKNRIVEVCLEVEVAPLPRIEGRVPRIGLRDQSESRRLDRDVFGRRRLGPFRSLPQAQRRVREKVTRAEIEAGRDPAQCFEIKAGKLLIDRNRGGAQPTDAEKVVVDLPQAHKAQQTPSVLRKIGTHCHSCRITVVGGVEPADTRDGRGRNLILLG